jgi:hypothetical protein
MTLMNQGSRAARARAALASCAIFSALALAMIVSAQTAQVAFPDGDGKAEFFFSGA